jgi:hypothetical protein
MLTVKEIFERLHKTALRLGLVVFVGLVLLTVVAPHRGHPVVPLSQRDMERMIGGFDECSNCDNCGPIWRTLSECFHYNPKEGEDPQFATCQYPMCIHTVFSSSSCLPDQGEDADGCDTREASPPAPAARKWVYEGDYVCPLEPWTQAFVWADVYFGCDTCFGFRCTHGVCVGYCSKSGDCYGTVGGTQSTGLKLQCGCS